MARNKKAFPAAAGKAEGTNSDQASWNQYTDQSLTAESASTL